MKPKMTKEEKAEERQTIKAFNHLIKMAKKKGALVSVEFFDNKVGYFIPLDVFKVRLTDED